MADRAFGIGLVRGPAQRHRGQCLVAFGRTLFQQLVQCHACAHLRRQRNVAGIGAGALGIPRQLHLAGKAAQRGAQFGAIHPGFLHDPDGVMAQHRFGIGHAAHQRGLQFGRRELPRAADRVERDAAHLRVGVIEQVSDHARGRVGRIDHLRQLAGQRDFFHAAQLVAAEPVQLEQQDVISQHRFLRGRHAAVRSRANAGP
ncbi:hypothetical protein D9M72_527940 [compost metagenome]